jgi:hypothetical protein
MDLEKMLRDKAAKKIEEEAAATEPAEQAALKAEALETEQGSNLAEQEEIARIEELRSTVAEYDNKIATTEELLQELTEVHEEARGTVESLAEQKKLHDEATLAVEQLFEDPVFKTILEEEGINSVDQLLEAEGFGDTVQAQAVIEGREKIQTGKELVKEKISERVQAKKGAYEALIDDNPEITRTYKELIGGLQEKIEELGAKRKEVYWQTPEGQEAKQAEMKVAVESKLAEKFSGYDMKRYWKETQYYGAKFKPDELAAAVSRELKNFSEEEQIYGTDSVRETIAATIKDRIDGQLDELYLNENNNSQKEEIVKKVETFQTSWENLKNDIPMLLAREEKVRAELTSLLESESGTSLKEQVKYFYDVRTDDAAKLASLVVKGSSALGWESKGHNGESFGSVGNSISVTEYLRSCLQQSGQYRGEQIIYEVLGGQIANIPDPTRLADVVEKQNLIFDKLESFLQSTDTSNEGKFEAMTQSYSSLDRTYLKVTPDEERRGYGYGQNYNNFKEGVEAARNQVENKKAELHEQFEQALADEQVIDEEYSFRQANTEVLNRVAAYERRSSKVAELLPQLSARALGLDESSQLETNVNSNLISYENYTSERDLLIKEKANKEAEKEEINNSTRDIHNRARSEGDGLFGSKKKRREEQLAPLIADRENKQAEIEKIIADITALNAREDSLNKLNSISRKVTELNLNVDQMPTSGTVGEFIASLKNALEQVTLSQEDSEIKKKFDELRQRSEAAQNRKSQLR